GVGINNGMFFRKEDRDQKSGHPMNRPMFAFGRTFRVSQIPSGLMSHWAFAAPAPLPSAKPQRSLNVSGSTPINTSSKHFFHHLPRAGRAVVKVAFKTKA